MREVAFDTETTGIDRERDRVIEIGAAELINHLPTGRVFQVYVNPGVPIPMEGTRLHGITAEFVREAPHFIDAVRGFLRFIGRDPLIAHNASFDVAMMNAELARISLPPLDDRRVIIDSQELAKRRWPGTVFTLDAVASRAGVNTAARKLHGGLIDAIILSKAYIALLGGPQRSLELDAPTTVSAGGSVAREPREPRHATEEELKLHAAHLGTLKDAIWTRYMTKPAEASADEIGTPQPTPGVHPQPPNAG